MNGCLDYGLTPNLAILDIFFTVSGTVARYAALVMLGYAVFRFRLLRWSVCSFMSRTVLWVTLPALLFSKLALANSLLAKYEQWYWLPISATGLYAVGGAIGYVLGRAMLPSKRERALCGVMCAFHNAGYLPLVIVRGIFPEMPDLDVLVMIYVLGASPLLWTVAPAVLAGGDRKGANPWRALNPPVVAVLTGFAAMMAGLGPWMQRVPVGPFSLADLTLAPLGMVGELTVPLVLLTLGGTLARLPHAKPKHPRIHAAVGGGKLLLLPAIALLVVPMLGLNAALAIVIIVGAMQPPALNLMVQAKEFGDEETAETIGEGLFFSYAMSLATLTFFLTVLKAMNTA